MNWLLLDSSSRLVVFWLSWLMYCMLCVMSGVGSRLNMFVWCCGLCEYL